MTATPDRNNYSFLVHRVGQIQRAVTVLRETLERRFRPDEVVETRLDDVELEVKMLLRELQKEK